MTFDPEAVGASLRREHDRQQAAQQQARGENAVPFVTKDDLEDALYRIRLDLTGKSSEPQGNTISNSRLGDAEEITFLQNVINMLQELHASSCDNFRRLEIVGDRTFGSEPQSDDRCASPTPTNHVQQIHELIRGLFMINNATREQISRIERIG